jgi:hypothetical protein
MIVLGSVGYVFVALGATVMALLIGGIVFVLLMGLAGACEAIANAINTEDDDEDEEEDV